MNRELLPKIRYSAKKNPTTQPYGCNHLLAPHSNSTQTLWKVELRTASPFGGSEYFRMHKGNFSKQISAHNHDAGADLLMVDAGVRRLSPTYLLVVTVCCLNFVFRMQNIVCDRGSSLEEIIVELNEVRSANSFLVCQGVPENDDVSISWTH